MKKRLLVLMFCSSVAFCMAGCGDTDSAQIEKTEAIVSQDNESETETVESQDKESEIEESQDKSGEQTIPVCEEIAVVEAAYQEILSRDSSTYTQIDMNTECYEEYELWNNELNILWEQIESTLDEDAFASLLDEQRVWLERKKFHMRASGSEAAGGSMQPMLESGSAAEITRVRCYQLAKVLADARKEQFSMEEIEAVVDYVDPSYDDVMWAFRGSYDLVSYDDSTGSLVISHESDEWEAIITYEGERQQVELWGYNSDHIIWKSSEDEFFEVGLSFENALEFHYRDDLKEYVDAYN